MSLDVYLYPDPSCEYGDHVYWRNITHNVNKMADEAGIYKALWRPEEINISFAKELIPILKEGLKTLKGDREHFETFNPSNGWGDYDGLVSFVSSYLSACEEYPESTIYISR